jgi:hypothetical protein
LGDIFQKRMRPMPKNFAQIAKFRPIWSHCSTQLLQPSTSRFWQQFFRGSETFFSFRCFQSKITTAVDDRFFWAADQGDQIGRIFAYWAIDNFRKFLENPINCSYFLATLATFRAIFRKLSHTAADKKLLSEYLFLDVVKTRTFGFWLFLQDLEVKQIHTLFRVIYLYSNK